MNLKNKILIFCLILISSFLICKKSFASDLYSQTIASTTTTLVHDSSYSLRQVFYNYIGNEPYNLKLKICRNGSFSANANITFSIGKIQYSKSDGSLTCPSKVNIKSNYGFHNVCFTDASPIFLTTYTYGQANTYLPDCSAGEPSPINIIPDWSGLLDQDEFYYIEVNVFNGGGYHSSVNVYDNNYNPFVYLSLNELVTKKESGMYDTGFTIYSNKDLYFAISSNIYGDYVNLTKPTSTTTPYRDFTSWLSTFYTNATSTSLKLRTHFFNNLSPTSISINSETIPSSMTGFYVNWSMPKINKLVDGAYTAWQTIDYIDWSTGGYKTLATSSINVFLIDNLNGAITFPEQTYFASSTYDHICDNIATSSGSFYDDFRFGIECGFQKILYWSFYPSDDKVQELSNSYDQMKNVFPFSAYYGISDAINASIATSTITATNGTLKMPFINKTGDYVILTVASSSSLPNLIGGSNANLFRNSFSWLIWISTAFAIFMTFKKI